MDNRNDPRIRPGMADRSANGAQGLTLTSRLLENYQLLHEYAQKGTTGEFYAYDQGFYDDLLADRKSVV